MLNQAIKEWQGKWIWKDESEAAVGRYEHQLVYFRKTFILPDSHLEGLRLFATADSRYRFYVNGKSVSVGPCKGHEHVQYYESIQLDIGSKLRPGINVLAVAVLHYAGLQPFEIGLDGPLSVWRSRTGGLLAEVVMTDGNGHPVSTVVSSDESWKCYPIPSYRLEPDMLIRWMGGLEHSIGKDIPHGWLEADYDDSNWSNAVVVPAGGDEYGQLGPWNLIERPIPPLYETERTFLSVVRSSYKDPVTINEPMIADVGSRTWVELDAGELTTGYIRLAIEGGAGSRVKLLCSECYEESSGSSEVRRKRVRDQADSGELIGGYDHYEPAGVGVAGQEELFEPFWFRTFRYVRLEIEAGAEPVVIRNISYRETGYPLEVKASFACSDERYNRLWELSLRTLKRCMHETYEDCPYYEQLQYSMDTKLMMQFTYLISGDDRLARRAMEDFHASQLPSGMLQSRYPSVMPQIIPSFSLYWIHMIKDHYRYYGDLELVKSYRPAIISLLNWFEQQLTAEGMVAQAPSSYWNYFDWVEEWPLGAPPSASEGPVTLMSLMYAAALETAADLFRETGWTQVAGEWLSKKQEVIQVVNETCWSQESELYRDGPHAEQYSQHTQIWAVLAGAVNMEDEKALLDRTMTDKENNMAKVSLPMSYYLFRSLQSTGQYEQSFSLWDRWLEMLDLGLTTLPEIDSMDTRSDCHAWSSLPLSEFMTGILGVSSSWDSGNFQIEIRPHFGQLEWAKGSAATSQGMVDVDWKLSTSPKGGRSIILSINSPEGYPALVVLPGGQTFTHKGGLFQTVVEG